MYTIDYDGQDIVIRLKKTQVDSDNLAKLLDYLELESIRNNSLLADGDAAQLAQEIDEKVWTEMRQRGEER